MTTQTIQQPPASKSRFFYGYIVVIASLLIIVAMEGLYFAFGVFFKPVLTEFGWTGVMTSGAFSLSVMVNGLLTIATGALTDKFGPRIVLTVCGLLLGLGYLLMSQISYIWQLYLFYGLVIGAGMSGAFVPLNTTIARWFVKRRGTMTGIVVSGIGIGTLVAPPVANWLITSFGWRQSYIILGTTVLVVVILVAQLLRRDPAKVGQLPDGDYKGFHPGLAPRSVEFSLKEASTTKQFWLSLSLFFCFGFCMFAVFVHIVPHSIELQIPSDRAAYILATIGGLSIVGRLVLGNIADKIGNRQAFIISFALISAAFFWLVLSRQEWMLYIFAIVFGFAYGGGEALQSPLVANLFGLDSHGLILAVTGLGFFAGASFGPLLAGFIFDVTGSYQMAFLLCATIAILGLIFTVFLKPTNIRIQIDNYGVEG